MNNTLYSIEKHIKKISIISSLCYGICILLLIYLIVPDIINNIKKIEDPTERGLIYIALAIFAHSWIISSKK